MGDNATLTSEMIKYNERLRRVEDAVALKEPDRIPLAPFFSGAIQSLYGSSYRNIYYDFGKASDAVLRFYADYPQCDAGYGPLLTSGRSLELVGFNFADWPGRPGTRVSDYSTHQILEKEYMTQEEYPELLRDFTGFMLRKFIPRVFDNVKGFENIVFRPATLHGASMLAPFSSPQMEETYRLLFEAGRLGDEADAAAQELARKLTAIGMPTMFMSTSEAPYDILGDYFRGTLGIMHDLIDHEDEIKEACDMFAEQQIQALQYLRHVPGPGKRMFFPLHKGMDGFMSPRQYEELYWRPLKKILTALIDMDVTPYIYTEGKYDARLPLLTDVPRGKVIYHFEDVDMRQAKRLFSSVACFTGNLPVAMVEFGKKEKVADYCKFLIDVCAPGGGYIFDFNGSLENAPRENIDVIFETFETYK